MPAHRLAPANLARRADTAVINAMRSHGLRLLRYSLALVFIWFGLLKVLGLSPVAELVAATLYWLPADQVVPALGAWEAIIGLGLLLGRGMRLVLLMFWLQLAGTFLVLLLRPDVAFQDGNPLLLTTTGEFVIKNLVLISAGIVLGGTVRRGRLAAAGPGRVQPA